jgi:hypothetical protein
VSDYLIYYLIEGSTIAKHKINSALNVAIFEEMATSVVIQSILMAKEAAPVEGCFVTTDSECHSLASHCTWSWSLCSILHFPHTHTHKYIDSTFYSVDQSIFVNRMALIQKPVVGLCCTFDKMDKYQMDRLFIRSDNCSLSLSPFDL